MNSYFAPTPPVNEEVLRYAPSSPERHALTKQLHHLSSQIVDIPLIIDGEEVRTGNTLTCVMPHAHHHVLANYHLAGENEIKHAIDSALRAQSTWASMPFEQRAAIFQKAAHRLATTDRATINAATMLAQSKNIHQAEIDSACELIDFLRFNIHFAHQIYLDQPISTSGSLNRMSYRPLEGFIYAITPFNFTAIGANLACAPALMGNVTLWKPAASAVYSNYMFLKLLMECGLPKGVINFIPGNAQEITKICLDHSHLAGIHFTGSTEVFNTLWKTVSANLSLYKSYPRLVGETGGKDFVFAHPSADTLSLSVALIQGAFEYQGQKCSAASRAYIPESIANEVLFRMKDMLNEIKVGDVRDYQNFMNAVIDQRAFDRIKGYIDHAKKDPDIEVFHGGTCDDGVGYFIEPTVLITRNPMSITMTEEIFGPVLSIYIYPDHNLQETLDILDKGTPYALTGAIFAKERSVIEWLENRLVNTAGNFYINDKPTGAVVGQQPFGGSRASGTNDKAGSKLNLLRWVSPRTIKENYAPLWDYKQPFLD
jgi:1-pyrroline-5-carboxylate dehydrogenase